MLSLPYAINLCCYFLKPRSCIDALALRISEQFDNLDSGLCRGMSTSYH